MKTINVEVTGFGPMDYVMLLPHAVVGDGEPGDKLSPELQEYLRWMASIGFWPVDWIEGGEGYDGLWFKRVLKEDINVALQQCEHFIKKGGYV